MEKLFEARGAVMAGIRPDEELAESVLWLEGENLTSMGRSVQPVASQYSVVPKLSSTPILGMLETNLWVDDERQLWWGSTTSLYRFILNGSGLIDVTPISWIADRSRSDFWSYQEFFDDIFVVGNSGLYRIQDGDANFLLVTTAPNWTTGKILAKLGRHLVIFNTDVDSRHWVWCDTNEGTDWTSTASNAAGASQFTDMDGEIECVVPLGRGLGVYSRNEVHLVTNVGFPLYLVSNKLIPKGIGAVSPQSVVSVKGVHYGFGPKGIWRTDGNTYDYIDTTSVNHFIYSDFTEELTRQKYVVAWHNIRETSVVFFWPGKDSIENDRSIAYNYSTGTWWQMGYNRTARTEGEIFGAAILGDALGNVFAQATHGATTSASGLTPSTVGLPLQVQTRPTILQQWNCGGWNVAGWGGENILGDDIGAG